MNMNTDGLVGSFDEWMRMNRLNEKKGDTYDSGCLMVYIQPASINSLHKSISKSDLYEEDGDRSYGIEDEPHISLLYGLHDDEIEDHNKVIEKAQIMPIGAIRLKNLSMFEKDNYDILKFDVQNPALAKLNSALAKQFPHTSEYDFHPHVTIGYVKKGQGQKYIDLFKGKSFDVNPSKIVYSKKDGTKLEKTISE